MSSFPNLSPELFSSLSINQNTEIYLSYSSQNDMLNMKIDFNENLSINYNINRTLHHNLNQPKTKNHTDLIINYINKQKEKFFSNYRQLYIV